MPHVGNGVPDDLTAHLRDRLRCMRVLIGTLNTGEANDQRTLNATKMRNGHQNDPPARALAARVLTDPPPRPKARGRLRGVSDRRRRRPPDGRRRRRPTTMRAPGRGRRRQSPFAANEGFPDAPGPFRRVCDRRHEGHRGRLVGTTSADSHSSWAVSDPGSVPVATARESTTNAPQGPGDPTGWRAPAPGGSVADRRGSSGYN